VQEQEGVRACTADQPVVPHAGRQRIRAGPAAQRVVAGIARKHVVAGARDQSVRAIATDERIGTLMRIEGVPETGKVLDRSNQRKAGIRPTRAVEPVTAGTAPPNGAFGQA